MTLQWLPCCIFFNFFIQLYGQKHLFNIEKLIIAEFKRSQILILFKPLRRWKIQTGSHDCWILRTINVKCYCCSIEWNALLKLFKICIYFWLALGKLLLTAVMKTIKKRCFFLNKIVKLFPVIQLVTVLVGGGVSGDAADYCLWGGRCPAENHVTRRRFLSFLRKCSRCSASTSLMLLTLPTSSSFWTYLCRERGSCPTMPSDMLPRQTTYCSVLSISQDGVLVRSEQVNNSVWSIWDPSCQDVQSVSRQPVKEERRGEGCGSGPEEDTRRSLHWTVYTWLVIVFSRDIRLTDVAQSVAGESRGTGWKEAGQEVRARRHRKWPWRDFKKLCSLTETRGTASGGSVSHWPPVQRHSSWKCKEV